MPNIYDNLPPCKSPWDDDEDDEYYYHPKFKYNTNFNFIFLFFDYSKSKNYKKAIRIYNSIPDRFRIELQAHCVQIFHYSDYLVIRKKFTRLIGLVHNWKSAQIWINNELCTERDFREFIEIFDRRVRQYKRHHTLPDITEE